MIQTGKHKWGFALTSLARAFVAAFAGVVLYCFLGNLPSSLFSHAAKLILFVTLLAWRLLRRKAIFFIPDEMLLALPWFWLVSLTANIHQWHLGWVAAALVLALLSAISRPYCYNWFKGGVFGNSLYAAVIFSAGFYFSFAVLLSRVFSGFTHELLITSWHSGIWVFAGIFIMNAAFHNLVAVSGKDGQSALSAAESQDAA